MGSHDDEQPNIPGSGPVGHETDREDSTERMDDYVQLHDFIERLREDRKPRPVPIDSVELARIYHMAVQFRAAGPRAADPDPAFISALRQQLAEQPLEDLASAPASQPSAASPRRRVSRRAILGTGLSAAAAVVGVVAGAGLEHAMTPAAKSPPPSNVPLVPAGVGVWVAVALADSIPVGGVIRFQTDYIVGYVRHAADGFTALSSICTHMGCLLQWNPGQRTYDCPCHGGRFAEDGQTAPQSPIEYAPLPKLQTRVEDGQVWVYVVPPQTPGTLASPTRAPGKSRYGGS